MNKLMRRSDVRATHCANCGTTLQGPWCHACGQSSKHMLRHLPGLIEDAADVLLNLDSRVARTLPTLYFFPGRLTREYLSGRRVRYVTPFRLMFVLCLLSFFFLHISLNLDIGGAAGEADTSVFAQAQTPQDVLQRLDALRAQMNVTGQVPSKTPGIEDMMKLSRQSLDAAALDRLRKVLPGHAPSAAEAARIDTLMRDSVAGASSPSMLQQRLATVLAVADATAPTDAARTQQREHLQQLAGARLTQLHEAKTATRTTRHDTHAADISGWFHHRLERLETNTMRLNSNDADRDLLIGQVFSVLPQSMLVLVPVFALLLQLIYLFRRRLYMEHLIVSLHSHAFLFMSLLILIGLGALRGVLPDWAAMPVGWLWGIVWLWIPVYLLLMQKRVYDQGWGQTILKYMVTGSVYVVLLSLTVAGATLIGLAG